MKNLLYQSIKLSLGVILAIYIASIFHLNFVTTAGIITLLSVLDTRKQTYIVGLKRFSSGVIAIVLSSVLFTIGGHTLPMLGIFLLIFIPLGAALKNTEGLSVSTVLVTHIYTISYIDVNVVINEVLLLLIGILVAWTLNIHVLNHKEDVLSYQLKTEELMKLVLHKMSLQLLNQCSVSEQQTNFVELEKVIKNGYDIAITYHNNSLFTDRSYFIHYFRMREEQLHVLQQMEKHFQQIFIAQKQAIPLSNLTKDLALRFDECNDGTDTLEDASRLLEHYKSSTLPKTREEFENRATLYQYLSDLVLFVEIKRKFMERFDSIRYCA